MDILAALARALVGVPSVIPPTLLGAYPELGLVRLRRGGLPPRLGGWCLGRRWVDGITIGRHVWLAPPTPMSAELLLHELRHVHQFQALAAFPLRYWWETLRRGYLNNRFEVDARRFAAERLTRAMTPLQPEE
ncbi:MAG: hypothetical protein IT361_16120 [Gemmatimonadaceae bacterium]|nr:hypothetical protein [Gemmatimonadaceae bacterium]